MYQELLDHAMNLIKRNSYHEAIEPLLKYLEFDQLNWNAWYLTGQCYRFLKDYGNAIKYLNRAINLNNDDSSIYLALGIAYQLNMQFNEAIEVFRSGNKIDPDNELIINSLALTQKRIGELDKALHNFDLGLKTLARKIAKKMQNNRNSKIYKHQDTYGNLWIEYVTFAAIYLASLDNINEIAFPSGELAIEEERTETHSGLYWLDTREESGKIVRLFLPNFFNFFRESFMSNSSYANLLGNKGSVLALLGRDSEAKEHFDEANEFLYY